MKNNDLIRLDDLFKCETCFYHQSGRCNTWCDAGESYRPAVSKLTKVDVPDALPPVSEVPPVVKVALDEGAIMPTYAHPGWDAGMDLYAREDACVHKWCQRSFDTGVHIQIPQGYAGIVTGKSGLDHKHGITCHGLVDAGYTGSVRVNLYNCSKANYQVKAGDKIAQLVIVPVLTPELLQVGDIDGGERGDAGFGSTGR